MTAPPAAAASTARSRPRSLPLATLFAAPSVVLVAFVVLPLVALVYRASRDGEVGARLGDDFVLTALRLSLLTSTLTLVITMLLGTPLTYLLVRTRFPG